MGGKYSLGLKGLLELWQNKKKRSLLYTDPKIKELEKDYKAASELFELSGIIQRFKIQSEIAARGGYPEYVVMDLEYGQIDGKTWGGCSDKVKLIGVSKGVFRWLEDHKYRPKLKKVKENPYTQTHLTGWRIVVAWVEE